MASLAPSRGDGPGRDGVPARIAAPARGAGAAPSGGLAFSDRQLDLIKRAVAPETQRAEFDLFCAVAQRAQLDPLKRQISALVFNKADADKRRMAIVTTIDGLRAIAARSCRYRPDEDEPEYEVDPAAQSPANPQGLIKAKVRIHLRDAQGGDWRPVTGIAYWAEFAPLKETCEAGYAWVETGAAWPADHPTKAGRPKMGKLPQGPTTLEVDPAGSWGRMPRLMLAKCAEAQALRKAFPEDLSGLYEGAELDRARAEELTASERIEALQTEARQRQVGAAGTLLLSLVPDRGIEAVPLGQVADRILAALRDFDRPALSWFEATNTYPLREFWARAKSDALAVKRAIEARKAELAGAAPGDG
jgi:phage recombination protein Bet